MVISVCQIGKFYFKLENHHHHHHESEALSASLQGFRSDISASLSDLTLNPKPGSEILSFPWIKRCLELIRVLHKAFAKLIVDVDYPIRGWKACSMDEFLKYTLKLLELFNSISSSLSHLAQARLKLSHALSSVETAPSSALERLKAIESSSFSKNSIKEGETEENRVEILNSEKESVIHHALMIMQHIGFWACGIVISGLCGDAEPYMEMRKSTLKSEIFSLDSFDSIVHQAICDSGVRSKEVEEVNEALDRLVASMAAGKSSDAAAEELQKRLEVLEKNMEDLGKEVDSLFSDVLEERNKLLDCLRVKQQK